VRSKREPTGKVTIYCRVATSEQAECAAIYARSAVKDQRPGEGRITNIDRQIAVCSSYCTEHGYVVDEKHVYSEIISGNRLRSPQLDTLLCAAKEHQFSVLVITSLDRLARDMQHRTMILEELIQTGVTIETIDGCRLDKAAWKLVQAATQDIRDMLVQMEREQLIKRMQSSKTAKKVQREQQ
jgi:DNA invertase Pin-like site-specific DNA recombinase